MCVGGYGLSVKRWVREVMESMEIVGGIFGRVEGLEGFW